MGIWQRRGAEGSPKDGKEKHRLTDVHQAEREGIRRGWDRWGSRKDFRKRS